MSEIECSTKHSDPAIFSETHNLVFLEKTTSEKIQQALTLWVEEMRAWANSHAYTNMRIIYGNN